MIYLLSFLLVFGLSFAGLTAYDVVVGKLVFPGLPNLFPKHKPKEKSKPRHKAHPAQTSANVDLAHEKYPGFKMLANYAALNPYNPSEPQGRWQKFISRFSGQEDYYAAEGFRPIGHPYAFAKAARYGISDLRYVSQDTYDKFAQHGRLEPSFLGWILRAPLPQVKIPPLAYAWVLYDGDGYDLASGSTLTNIKYQEDAEFEHLDDSTLMQFVTFQIHSRKITWIDISAPVEPTTDGHFRRAAHLLYKTYLLAYLCVFIKPVVTSYPHFAGNDDELIAKVRIALDGYLKKYRPNLVSEYLGSHEEYAHLALQNPGYFLTHAYIVLHATAGVYGLGRINMAVDMLRALNLLVVLIRPYAPNPENLQSVVQWMVQAVADGLRLSSEELALVKAKVAANALHNDSQEYVPERTVLTTEPSWLKHYVFSEVEFIGDYIRPYQFPVLPR